MKSRYQAFQLFYSLIKTLKPDIIYEIGSRDGKDAIKLKDFLPETKVIAFEANPKNFESIISNQIFCQKKINIENLALSNKDGYLEFYLYDKPGLGSLHKRIDQNYNHVFKVRSVRLDQYHFSVMQQNIALWIDVEGAALEVLEGSSGILNSVSLIYTELEVDDVYGKGATRLPIKIYLANNGFYELQFTPHGRVEGKVRVGDSLFINRRHVKKAIPVIAKHLFLSFLVESKIRIYEILDAYFPFAVRIWKYGQK